MSQINFDLQASHSIISILEKSKLYSEALLKNLPDIFLLINHEGIVLKGNASVSTYFKVDSEMLLGQQLKKLLKAECWNIFLSKIDLLLKTETKNIDFELTLGTEPETEKVYYWSLSLIRKASPKTGPIIAVIGRDITELRKQERKLMEMFSCMPIGIVTIEKDCLVETPYSAYTEYLLGQSNLYGKDFFEILFKKCHQLSELDKEGIKNLTKFYRLNFSTFEMMESTFPKKIKYPIETENKVEYRHFGLTYQPIVYENEVRRLMILIEDRTAIVNLEEENSKRRALEDTHIQRIVQLKTCDHEILPDVINELQQLVSLCQNLIQKGQMQELAHKLHGVKGNARIGDFRVLMNMAHALEKEVLNGQISEEDLTAQFAEIENEWKELMRMYLTLFFESIKLPTQVDNRLYTFRKKLQKQAEITAESLGKKVKLILEVKAEDIADDMLSALSEICMHLVNNSIDHGIEQPGDRLVAGKNEVGIIKIEIKSDYHGLLVYLSDDGAGIVLSKIKERAIKNGIINLDDKVSDEYLTKLIFEKNFSTSNQVTEISGRGIGLGAVKKKIEELSGWIKVENNPVELCGSCFTFFIKFNKKGQGRKAS